MKRETVGFHYSLQFNCLRWPVTICLGGSERSEPVARQSRTGHATVLHEVASGQRASSLTQVREMGWPSQAPGQRDMAARDLISKRTRTEFREALSGWGTLRTIDIAFENEDFTPDISFEPDFGGQRRTRVEEYYHAIDFADPQQIFRLLRVYEGIILDIELQSPEVAGKLRQHLERDGYKFEDRRPVSL